MTPITSTVLPALAAGIVGDRQLVSTGTIADCQDPVVIDAAGLVWPTYYEAAVSVRALAGARRMAGYRGASENARVELAATRRVTA